MSAQKMLACALGGVLAVGVGSSAARATIPYSSAGGPFPGFGTAIAAPPIVGGKEYSHSGDSTAVGGGVVGPPPFDAEQVIAWDGVGGVVDVTDYTGTRPIYTSDDEIDALANGGDFAYPELKADLAHLVFSVDDAYTVYSFGAPGPALLPAAGPVGLANGNTIGGAGEYSVEECFGCGNPVPDTQTLWAAQAAINGMPLPDDVDGLEVWGPEPPAADADKYSLEFDIFSAGVVPGDAVSVWNASGTPYVLHSAIVGAVTALLPGPIPTEIFVEDLINVDALMVQDTIDDPDLFQTGPGGPVGPGPGDEIIFSIRQIANPSDPDGYYATGSELFVLNAGAPPAYLAHGGHLWDHAYSLAAFDVWSLDPVNYGVIDINAIEAIGQFAIPEPSSAVMAIFAVIGLGLTRRRGA